MAIDPVDLVEIDLDPVFTLDTTIQAAIPARVDAEIALQGWTLADVDDQRAVYIATLTTKSFIPRLLLKFAQEIKRAKGGKAETEFQDGVKYLQALQEELQDRLQRAAQEADPEDVLGDPVPWPGTGVVSF